MAGAYEKPAHLPPCLAGFGMGAGFNGSYVEPAALQYGYRGSVINTDLGFFDKAFVATDVDHELQFAAGDPPSIQLERLAGGGVLGELCRRVVLRVWRGHSPPSAWVALSLPTVAAMLCVTDSSESLVAVKRMMRALWDWDPDATHRRTIQKLFCAVFSRAAALSAVAIASLARRTGKLHSSGLTVALEATVHLCYPWFLTRIRQYLATILGPNVAKQIHLYVVPAASQKGAALLSLSPERRSDEL
eukprot:Protomagalhaensia_sp_Gyna_25__3895@NODE_34_length_6868_cov_319_110265_g24_i0_p5_GENE_NODE_34_length_6868_cov_319_110265_g24_i0NODE_34_length_6868_cov_319_110265_g24_i0_p5_ORF_typecomplete_len246_score26_95Hexokinase_2/PF03727_16/6_4e30T2SSF/PF00482_23/0_22_NODE_34_length_6868_cov_319_110265_g24_i052295966